MPRMNLLVPFVVAMHVHNLAAAIHTLNYFIATTSQIPNLPEYWELAYVDGVQILRFDSNSRKTKAKQDWVNKIAAEDLDFWEKESHNSLANEQVLKVSIENLKKRFNQTRGVHMIQRKIGCEWDDETGEVDGWEHYSYDGEEFISFELKTMRWIAAHQQAFITKNNWDQLDFIKEHWKLFLTETCPDQLKKHVRHGRDFLMRTELPTVSLLQKMPSSPVTCHATGFYPRASALFWRKGSEVIHEDVVMGETLPNHDGTFQTTAHLKVEVTAGVEGKYECVFQLAGVKEDIVTKLDRRIILSNARIQEEDVKKMMTIFVTILALVGVVVVVVVVARFHNQIR